jgi:hypothetical protein
MNRQDLSKLLAGAAIAGLLSGSALKAAEMTDTPKKADAKTEKKKDSCKSKDGCKSKDAKHEKKKDSCKGKDGCKSMM